MIKRLLITAMAIGLTACATTDPEVAKADIEKQQRERAEAERRAQQKASSDQLQACYRDGIKAFKGSALDGVILRLDENGKRMPPSSEMRLSMHRLTKAEKNAFSAYDQLATKCGSMNVEYFQTYFPAYAPVKKEEIDRAAANRALLYKGELTVGEYLTRAQAYQQVYQHELIKAEEEKRGAAFSNAIGTTQMERAQR